ncbi:O-antigen ligase family protein [Sphingomonas sp. BGYR3]|uniref:O-antigen ligase family protein n=1 Tax=Sphingomonas sp. BGYR3 TaxID=2975483 RepID=UPI0021A54681|nr:O-antigen ligase family protein [Sphingomonas sp. BGYR3]MDG5488549.1 O-antigen ligase family protein [Sphingomonas sp. BGYR3]
MPRLSLPVIAFAIMACTIALTGGSARVDIGWLLILRPIVVVSIVAMLLPERLPWSDLRPLPILLAVFALTIAIQLVPLPPSLWSSLAGREQHLAVAQALGGKGQWHPLALAPDRAWNSLVALLVPLGMMIGFLKLNDDQKKLALLILLGVVAFTMMLGIAQIATGGTSPLYWYRVSGRGQMIGLLANRNHQGALLAMTLPLLRAWTLFPASSPKAGRLRNIVALSAGTVIILYTIILGSRAGFVLALVGAMGAFLVQPSFGRKLTRSQRLMLVGGLILGIAVIFGLALAADRAVTLGRITEDDLSAEGRFAAMPTLLHIISQTFPFGTGFGSFVPIYASYEPESLLKPTYFNAAHNDLIELMITGGLPAIAAFVAFLIWWLKACWRSIATTAPRPWRALKRASGFSTLILMLASLADYPLRTPILGAVFTILCCWLAYNPDTTGRKSA